MSRTPCVPAMLLLSVCVMTACGGGGASAVSSGSVATPVGQQLTELQTAYAEGRISEAEYDQRRNAILQAG